MNKNNKKTLEEIDRLIQRADGTKWNEQGSFLLLGAIAKGIRYLVEEKKITDVLRKKDEQIRIAKHERQLAINSHSQACKRIAELEKELKLEKMKDDVDDRIVKAMFSYDAGAKDAAKEIVSFIQKEKTPYPSDIFVSKKYEIWRRMWQNWREIIISQLSREFLDEAKYLGKKKVK